jgi:MFS family permease
MKPRLIAMLTNIAVSSSLLFIPNLAKELNATDLQIGVIGAVYGLTTFISSYIFGRASDIYSKRFFIRLGLGVSTIAFSLQAFTDPSFIMPILLDPWFLAFTRGLVGFSLGIFPAALTAFVHESKESLGHFTSFGALGWSIGTFITGIIAFYWGAFLFSSLCVFFAFLISFTMEEIKTSALRVPLLPYGVLRKNWHVYLSFFLRHAGANGIWLIYPLYIIDLGGDKFWIGVIYTINTVVQFIVMPFLDRFAEKTLINLGLTFSLATFILLALTQHFTQLIPVQVLLAASWSCLYIGSLTYLMKHNIEKATSVGLLTSVLSLSQVFGSLIGGAVSYFFGYRGTMYVAVLLTVLAFLIYRVATGKSSSKSLI